MISELPYRKQQAAMLDIEKMIFAEELFVLSNSINNSYNLQTYHLRQT